MQELREEFSKKGVHTRNLHKICFGNDTGTSMFRIVT